MIAKRTEHNTHNTGEKKETKKTTTAEEEKKNKTRANMLAKLKLKKDFNKKK